MRVGLLLGFIGAVLAISAATGAQGYTEKVIHNFCRNRCPEGSGPSGYLARDASGNLYGVTDDGKGPKSQGTVFELTPLGQRWKTKVLYRFKGQEFDEPRSGLILDVDGNIYGVARDQLFELQHNADRSEWALVTLYRFCHTLRCRALNTPISRLTYVGAASGTLYDGVSPLYGTTDGGGKHHSGVVYELVPNEGTWALTVLHDFCGGSDCPDGMSPFGDIVVTQDAIYGVTNWGGNLSECGDTGCGVVYQLSPRHEGTSGGWKQDVLHRFCIDIDCSDGMHPRGVTIDASGALIGAAQAGGASDEGVIFKLTPHGESSHYSVVHDFCSTCGEPTDPQSAVTIDASGAIFGAAGEAPGAVYKLDGASLTTIYKFCSLSNCRDGDFMTGGLLLDETGNIYGATMAGGSKDHGTVFELSP